MGCASSQEEAPAQSANASKYAVDAAASKAQHAPSAVDAANKLVAKTDATGSAAEVNGKHVADGAAAAANAVAKVVATNGATPTASPRPGETAQPAPAPAAPATPAAAAAAAQTGAASAVAAQDTLMKVRHCPRASRRVSHPCYPMVATWAQMEPRSAACSVNACAYTDACCARRSARSCRSLRRCAASVQRRCRCCARCWTSWSPIARPSSHGKSHGWVVHHRHAWKGANADTHICSMCHAASKS